LFGELKQKVSELDKTATPEDQTGSTFDRDEIISLIEELKVLINQQRCSPEQIKSLGQISAYSIYKVNENFSKTFDELKAEIKPIYEEITQI
jgi:hypothetical protein